MNETVSADGTVAAASTEDLSFSASGTVTAVNVKAGDHVTTGQVLATVEAPELWSAVAAAESSVAEAEAALDDARSSGASDAQLAADEASLTVARDGLTNAKENLAGVALVAGFDGTVTSVNVAVGERLASGGVGGTQSTGSQSGSGQSAGGGDSSGTLPGGGGATGSQDTSTSSTSHIQVVSTNRYSVELDVDSTSVDAIEAGQEVTLTVTTGSSSGGFPNFPGGGGGFTFPGGGGGGLPDLGGGNGGNGGGGADGGGQDTTTPGAGTTAATATGKVAEVGAVANADSGVARYPVSVTFTAGSDEFVVGATVSADIVTTARDDVLQIPVRAVTTEDGVSKVTVAVDGTADGATESRTVETGLTASGMVEITKGLKAGEQVIVETPALFGGGADGGAGNGDAPPDVPTGGFPTGNVDGAG
jgi:macrolide-specific efflux system membrane fusion protein